MNPQEEAREMKRLNRVSNSNRPDGYNTPATPKTEKHTLPLLTLSADHCAVYVPGGEAGLGVWLSANQIVRAVNAHEALLFCLKEAHEEELRNNHYGDGPQGCSYCKAIAQAEGHV